MLMVLCDSFGVHFSLFEIDKVSLQNPQIPLRLPVN